MLLFKKKDLLVVLSKSDETVQFTKPLKDILKYQHRYNYKFKMYENGAVTVADDYVINGETLTVLFGSATVSYTSEGASYTEGGSGGGSGCECKNLVITVTIDPDTQAPVLTPNLPYSELDTITGGYIRNNGKLNILTTVISESDHKTLYFIAEGATPAFVDLWYNSDGTVTTPK